MRLGRRTQSARMVADVRNCELLNPNVQRMMVGISKSYLDCVFTGWQSDEDYRFTASVRPVPRGSVDAYMDVTNAWTDVERHRAEDGLYSQVFRSIRDEHLSPG